MAKKRKTYVWKDPTFVAKASMLTMAYSAFFFAVLVVWAVIAGAAAVYDDVIEFTPMQTAKALFDATGLLVFFGSFFCLFWIVRVARNAHTFGRMMDHSAASALWWYIVPVASLVMPYLVMREIWDVSTPREERGDHKVLLVWWILHVIAGALAIPAMKLAQQAPTLDIVSNALFVGSTLGFFFVVRKLTAKQKVMHLRKEAEEALS
jgi:hypothetical protein